MAAMTRMKYRLYNLFMHGILKGDNPPAVVVVHKDGTPEQMAARARIQSEVHPWRWHRDLPEDPAEPTPACDEYYGPLESALDILRECCGTAGQVLLHYIQKEPAQCLLLFLEAGCLSAAYFQGGVMCMQSVKWPHLRTPEEQARHEAALIRLGISGAPTPAQGG